MLSSMESGVRRPELREAEPALLLRRESCSVVLIVDMRCFIRSSWSKSFAVSIGY